MESAVQLPGERIQDFALQCYEIIRSTPSKQAALTLVSDFSSIHIEKYLINALKDPDDLSLHFIDLLDQMAFEIIENIHYDDPVREYIVENFYARLNIYLDFFRGKDVYCGNINKRIFTHDDTVIIRQNGFSEYIPLLITEYYEQPALRRSVLRALYSFDSENLLNFYYGVFKEGNFIEEKILALLGLKRYEFKFNFDHLRSSAGEEYAKLIEYAKCFNCGAIDENAAPEDLNSLLYGLNFIELNRDAIRDFSAFAWLLKVLQPLLKIENCNSSVTDLYKTLSNIILGADPGRLAELSRDEELAVALVNTIDFLPCEYVYKLGIKLSLIESGFGRTINRLRSQGKLELDVSASNTMNYMLWESGNYS